MNLFPPILPCLAIQQSSKGTRNLQYSIQGVAIQALGPQFVVASLPLSQVEHPDGNAV